MKLKHWHPLIAPITCRFTRSNKHTSKKEFSFSVFEALGLGFLDTDHPNYPDNTLHTAVKRAMKSNPSVFRTKNLLAAITRVQVALENSLDQKLSSHFLIYKNSVLSCKTLNLKFEAHVIRTLTEQQKR